MLGPSPDIPKDKVAIYIRWSTDEQTHGTTLAVQHEACTHFILSQGWTVRDDLVFVDDGYSGGNLNRPAMSRLRQSVQAGDVKAIVVYKLDRLSRSVLDTVTLIRQEWHDKCTLISPRENFDTQSPVGQMIFNMLISFAEFERNLIRERTLSGKYKRAEAACNAGFKYHYGYKKGPDNHLVVAGWDEATQTFTGPAAVVRRIFQEYLSGMGTKSIADGLRRDGVPTAKGGQWRNRTIGIILRNPVYVGTYVYGRQVKGDPESARVWLPGAVPPIVTEDEFRRVQELIDQRSEIPARSFGSTYLLSGVAKCAKCGGGLVGKSGGFNNSRNYYYCLNHGQLGTCDCAQIEKNALEQAFIRELKSMLAMGPLQHQVDRIREEVANTAAVAQLAAKAAEEAIGHARRMIARLDADYERGEVSGRTYERQIAKWEEELERATQQLAQAEHEIAMAGTNTVDFGRIQQVAQTVDAWEHLTLQEMKQLIRTIVEELHVYQKPRGLGGKKTNPNPIVIKGKIKSALLIGDQMEMSADEETGQTAARVNSKACVREKEVFLTVIETVT